MTPVIEDATKAFPSILDQYPPADQQFNGSSLNGVFADVAPQYAEVSGGDGSKEIMLNETEQTVAEEPTTSSFGKASTNTWTAWNNFKGWVTNKLGFGKSKDDINLSDAPAPADGSSTDQTDQDVQDFGRTFGFPIDAPAPSPSNPAN